MTEDSRWVDAWDAPRSLHVLRALIQAGERIVPTVAARAGLSVNELRTLEHLVERPMGPGELAKQLGVTSAASSGIIDRLQERGHVRRVSHASDGRRTEVTITESGRAEVIGHLMPMFRELAEVDSTLTDAEREVVTRYLEGALNAVRHVL